MIQAIFFDVANTLLHKPTLIPTMSKVLGKYGVSVPDEEIFSRHRWLSEVSVFPDRTSRDFYGDFNAKLLRSLGISPTQNLLDDIFSSCKYLPWCPFDDAFVLEKERRPLGILSNWDESLNKNLLLIKNVEFQWILGSAQEKIRKPDLAFFQRILDETNLSPDQIAYVGDSLRLDIEPALALGVSAFLIDRDDFYPYANVPRIRSLMELERFL